MGLANRLVNRILKSGSDPDTPKQTLQLIAAEEFRQDALDLLFHILLHHVMPARVRVPLQ
jgi:hypothetical protein